MCGFYLSCNASLSDPDEELFTVSLVSKSHRTSFSASTNHHLLKSSAGSEASQALAIHRLTIRSSLSFSLHHFTPSLQFMAHLHTLLWISAQSKTPPPPLISFLTPPFSRLHIPVICLTLSMWQWSASSTDSKSCLIETTVHLFHHLPQRTCTHNHYLKHKMAPPPAAITSLRILPTGWLLAELHVSHVSVVWACLVFVYVRTPDWLIIVKSLKRAWFRTRNS